MRYNHDQAKMKVMSIVEENGEKRINMANLVKLMSLLRHPLTSLGGGIAQR